MGLELMYIYLVEVHDDPCLNARLCDVVGDYIAARVGRDILREAALCLHLILLHIIIIMCIIF